VANCGTPRQPFVFWTIRTFYCSSAISRLLRSRTSAHRRSHRRLVFEQPYSQTNPWSAGALANRVFPGIIMKGTSATSFKMPITTPLVEAIQFGQEGPTRYIEASKYRQLLPIFVRERSFQWSSLSLSISPLSLALKAGTVLIRLYTPHLLVLGPRPRATKRPLFMLISLTFCAPLVVTVTRSDDCLMGSFPLRE